MRMVLKLAGPIRALSIGVALGGILSGLWPLLPMQPTPPPTLMDPLAEDLKRLIKDQQKSLLETALVTEQVLELLKLVGR